MGARRPPCRFIQARANKTKVVACALECGPRWINEAARAKPSADYPDFDLEEPIRVFFSGYERGHSFPALSEQHRDAYEQLTDFLETLTLDCVSPKDNPLSWSPAWLSIGPRDVHRILFMRPPLQAQPFTAMRHRRCCCCCCTRRYTDRKRRFLLSPFDAEAAPRDLDCSG